MTESIEVVEMNLRDKVEMYYKESDFQDGQGGKLEFRRAAELAPGVVSVLDNLGEIDIFFETDGWEIAIDSPSPYSVFLESIRENAQQNMCPRYGFTVLAESAWNPFYMRSRTSFEGSLQAAKAYLKPKDGKKSPDWFESPRTD